MTDFTHLATTDTYLSILSDLNGRIDALTQLLSAGTPSGQADGAIRWNATTARFEIWSATAATWAPLVSKYAINVDQLDGFDSAAAATASTVPVRDSAGRMKAAAPAASDDVARKSETDAVTTLAGTKLAKASNLSDLASAVTARTNLGLGSAAVLASNKTGGLTAQYAASADNASALGGQAPSYYAPAGTAIANATHASTADSATNAGYATNAGHATSASSAANANTLGGYPASALAIGTAGQIWQEPGYENGVTYVNSHGHPLALAAYGQANENSFATLSIHVAGAIFSLSSVTTAGAQGTAVAGFAMVPTSESFAFAWTGAIYVIHCRALY